MGTPTKKSSRRPDPRAKNLIFERFRAFRNLNFLKNLRSNQNKRELTSRFQLMDAERLKFGGLRVRRRKLAGTEDLK